LVSKCGSVKVRYMESVIFHQTLVKNQVKLVEDAATVKVEEEEDQRSKSTITKLNRNVTTKKNQI
jgi:hypothetical protein